MVWLILGLVLWNVAHLGKSAGRGVRQRLIDRIGEDPYKGLIALSVLSALVLIVIGWRTTAPSTVYAPPTWGPHLTQTGVFLALVLFSASVTRNWISARLRHPQLTGVAAWAAAHLVSNGEQRSLLLFGGLLFWAVAEIVAINARDGAWKRPAPQPIKTVIMPLIAAAAAFAALWFAHPYFTGLPVSWG